MFIDGIDLAAGLESVNNDEEIYNEILQIYYDDGVSMLDVLKQNLQYSDLKLFITHTHAMKSASRGIGANEVSERFREMEFAGKDEDMDKIEEKFPACLDAFEKLLHNIKCYLDGDTSDEAEIDVSEVLKAMKTDMDNDDTDAFEDKLEKLEDVVSDGGIRTRLHEIRRAYDEFDYEQAVAIIENML